MFKKKKEVKKQLSNMTVEELENVKNNRFNNAVESGLFHKVLKLVLVYGKTVSLENLPFLEVCCGNEKTIFIKINFNFIYYAYNRHYDCSLPSGNIFDDTVRNIKVICKHKLVLSLSDKLFIQGNWISIINDLYNDIREIEKKEEEIHKEGRKKCEEQAKERCIADLSSIINLDNKEIASFITDLAK